MLMCFIEYKNTHILLDNKTQLSQEEYEFLTWCFGSGKQYAFYRE